MEVMIKQESRAEVDEIMNFLGGLNTEEKREFMAFIGGAKFARTLAQKQIMVGQADPLPEPPQKTA